MNTSAAVDQITSRLLLAQLGARRHYALARALEQQGLLAEFHTDIKAPEGILGAAAEFYPHRFLPGPARSILERRPESVPSAKIRSHSSLGLRYAWWRHRTKSLAAMTALHLRIGEEFAARVARKAKWKNIDGVIALHSAALPLLREAQKREKATILEQTILPRALEHEIIQRERDLYPDWEPGLEEDANWRAYADRELEEWAAADRILCGSNFVAEGIKRLAGADKAVAVVPPGVETTNWQLPPVEWPASGGLLNVLFVGKVGLRKGAHRLMEAAGQLKDEPFRFRFVGMRALAEKRIKSAPSNVEFIGSVPRSEMPNHYRWAHLFCLPTLVEGAAISCYEALSAGRPLLTTPNAGAPIVEGENGWLIPAGDTDALVKGLLNARQNGPPANATPLSALNYSLTDYAARLSSALGL